MAKLGNFFFNLEVAEIMKQTDRTACVCLFSHLSHVSGIAGECGFEITQISVPLQVQLLIIHPQNRCFVICVKRSKCCAHSSSAMSLTQLFLK